MKKLYFTRSRYLLVALLFVSSFSGIGAYKVWSSSAASKKSTATVRHLHSSGRFDRGAGTWGSELQDLIKSKKVSIVTLTEAAGRGDQAVSKWGGWNNVSGESIVAWDTQIWSKVDSKKVELAPGVPFFRSITANFVVLRHKETGERWLWVATHVPAGVSAGDGKFSNDARAVNKWKASMKDLSKEFDAYKSKNNIELKRTVISADWNIDLSRPNWQKIMKNYFPNKYTAVAVSYKGRGTYHNRVIDTSLVHASARVTEWDVIGDIKSSDHRPFFAEYKIED